jgi:uncharacterized protein with NRDE domain
MCLVLLLHDAHPDYRLILAANRDEFYDRPTLPAELWPDAPGLLAGRDLRAGGTWLGIDRTGRFAAVTNYRQGQREAAAVRSRGHLVSDYLLGRLSPRAHMAQVERDAKQYNGFNLIAGDAEEVVYFSNRKGVTRVLPPGVYGLSNHLLDTPWPKVTAGKVALGALVGETAAPRLMEELFALLSDRNRPADDLLPETGIGREWERLLSSAFIASPDYGTRSSTVILVSRDGRTAFGERRFGPDGAPAGEAHFEPAPAPHSLGAPKPSSA